MPANLENSAVATGLEKVSFHPSPKERGCFPKECSMAYYSAIKWKTVESVLMRWMNLELFKQSEVGQKEKDKYCILRHIYRI